MSTSFLDWAAVVSAFLSALAALGACVAAFRSYAVARLATRLASHSETGRVLADCIDELRLEFDRCDRKLWQLNLLLQDALNDEDVRSHGGENPRPLRHVAYEAGQMLERSGRQRKGYAEEFDLSWPLRGGFGASLTSEDWSKLLAVADHSYDSFEATFGKVLPGEKLLEAQAFRWCVHQLRRRLPGSAGRNGWQTLLASDAHVEAVAALESLLSVAHRVGVRLDAEMLRLRVTGAEIPQGSELGRSICALGDVLLATAELDTLGGYLSYSEYQDPSDFPAAAMCLFAAMHAFERAGSRLGRICQGNQSLVPTRFERGPADRDELNAGEQTYV